MLARALEPREYNRRLAGCLRPEGGGHELAGAPGAGAAKQHRRDAELPRRAEQEPVAQERQRRQSDMRRRVLHACNPVYTEGDQGPFCTCKHSHKHSH